MKNIALHKIVGTAFALIGILGAAALFFHMAGFAAQDKSIPDHGSLTDCRMCHQEKYKMWETSRHSRAIERVKSATETNADCSGCHTAEGVAARLQGNKVDPANAGNFNSITCIACHKPGSGAFPKMLVSDPGKLCSECHSQRAVLQGRGAAGIDEIRSLHSAVTCVACHMSESNHDMKVIRPDDPGLPDDRADACTRCHKGNTRRVYAESLRDWQNHYKEDMDPIEADMAAISTALKEKPDLLNEDLKAKLSVVRSNLFIIQRDGSRGAHNLDFALEIMATASKDIKEIKAAIK